MSAEQFTHTRASSSFQNNERALKDFYRAYPELFAGGKLELFAGVYFPVALLELRLLESASEEFDTIEHAVLLLVQAGLQDPQQICDVMGMPYNYVNKILELLEGYGHISGGRITELGIRSALEKVKYTKYEVNQKVQADTLSGVFFSREMAQTLLAMKTAEGTNFYVPHVLPRSELSSSIFSQLNEIIPRYKQRGVFHVNVEAVLEILSKEIKYTQGFLVRFGHLPHPFVILKCRSKKLGQTIMDWRPIAISKSTFETLGCPDIGTTVVEDSWLTPLDTLSDELVDQAAAMLANERVMEKFSKQLNKQFGVGWEHISLTDAVLDIFMNGQSLPPFSWELLQAVESITYSSRGIPYTGFAKNHFLPGVVCYVDTEDDGLKELSQRIVRLKESNHRLNLYPALKEILSNEDELILDRLKSALDSIEGTIQKEHRRNG